MYRAADDELAVFCGSLDRADVGLANTVVPTCMRSCCTFSLSSSPSTCLSISGSKLRRDCSHFLCFLDFGDEGGVVAVVSVSEGGLGVRRRCFLCEEGSGLGASSKLFSFASTSSSFCFRSLLADSLACSCDL